MTEQEKDIRTSEMNRLFHTIWSFLEHYPQMKGAMIPLAVTVAQLMVDPFVESNKSKPH